MSDWHPLSELPDLRSVGRIALDTETKDNGLAADRGSGWPHNDGYVCGISVACRVEGTIRAHYFPLKHPDSKNFDREQLIRWLQDLLASGVSIVTQNGLYDYGWLRADLGIKMPPSERMEEIGALATMVNENLHRYSLEALCAWRGLPGKDESLLLQGCAALGLIPKGKKKLNPAAHIWQLPAHFVGPYAEADAVSTLALYESLDPVLDQENTRNAYRLEVDLLPMVHEMRRRGNRIDVGAAERARDLILQKRDAVFAELSDKLGANISMAEIGAKNWLTATFAAHKIKYPLTEKGNPSFKAGNTGWMTRHSHWLPKLIVKADKYNNAAVNFLQGYILNYVVRGRVHPEINPHRGEQGGARSLRFSYSNPPLQLMPAHDEELAPLIRGVFLPEEEEVWAKPDLSQQEFRFIVHYAARHKLPKAAEAVERYRSDPDTDFHALVSEWTNIERQSAKNCNFAHAFGAGVRKFAEMINRPENEARVIFDRYDHELPFVSKLAQLCQRAARRDGYLTLYDGARRHFNNWAPGGKWKKGLGPCEFEEAQRRMNDPDHPWHRRPIWRTDVHKAMNALIQGSAARHTKRWMLACWREGIVPLLQMHDALDCSVWSPQQAELVARLGCEAVELEVPMKVDLGYGRNWADATHTWEELHNPKSTSASATAPESPIKEPAPEVREPKDEPALAAAEMPHTNPPPPPPPPPDDETPPPSGNGRGDFTGFQQDAYQRRSQSSPGPGPSPSPPAEYIYIDAQNHIYMKVVRTADKNFPTYHWDTGKGAWITGWPKCKEVIPYRLPELLAAAATEPVWICEGEKDTENVAALGLVATTNPGGALKFQAELAKWFNDKQLAYILEDNDDAGRAHTAKIMSALRGIVSTIAVISFSELPEKGDVSDWLAIGGNKQLLLARAEEAKKRASTHNYVHVNLATVTPVNHEWVWENHLVRGNLELMAGIKGGGKSQIHCQYVACATTGRQWPNQTPGIVPCRAIMVTAEDSAADTLVPRLMAAGADLKLIEEFKGIRRNNRDEMFLIGEHLDILEEMIRDFGDVGIVTIDPITAYMGSGKGFDSHRATDVRSQLSPLKKLAEKTGVCFSALTHPAKNASQRALDHFMGSAAFIHTARVGHICVPEMQDHEGGRRETRRYLFTTAATNISAKQPTLAYRIEVVEVGHDPSGKMIVAPVIRWDGEVSVSADEAVAATKSSKAKQPTARDFLLIILANGPALRNLIVERGAERGFSLDQLKRAKRGLEIKAYKKRGEGKHSPWLWALPHDVPADAEEGDE